MTDLATLRRLKADLANVPPDPFAGLPAAPPPPAPGTWLGQMAAEQERRRQERGEALRAEQERIAEEQRLIAEAKRLRRAENAPKIAALEAEIAGLETERRPLDDEIDARRRQIDDLR